MRRFMFALVILVGILITGPSASSAQAEQAKAGAAPRHEPPLPIR